MFLHICGDPREEQREDILVLLDSGKPTPKVGLENHPVNLSSGLFQPNEVECAPHYYLQWENFKHTRKQQAFSLSKTLSQSQWKISILIFIFLCHVGFSSNQCGKSKCTEVWVVGGRTLDFPGALRVERRAIVLTSSGQPSLSVRQPLGTAAALLESGGHHAYSVRTEPRWSSTWICCPATQ